VVKRLFIFDMDGTILNSMPTLTSLATDVIVEFHGVTIEQARQSYLDTVGLPFSQQLEKIAPKHPKNIAAASCYENRHRDWCPVFPLATGIDAALLAVRYAGHKTALVTSTDYRLLESLPHVRALKWDYIGGFHPDRPKMTQIFQARLAFPFPEWTPVLFGDSPSDKLGATIIGAEFYMVTCATVADIVFRILEESERD
jgi:phosphoglycolate phosphatase-like HAD superfamily hydrolase